MGRADYFKLGSWNVICDKCNRKRKREDTRLNWQNLLVCADTCWEPRHPQDLIEGIPDDQSVPIARPDVTASSGETTVKTTASRNAVTIDLNSTSGIYDGDSIGIVMDNGAAHWTYSDGDPSGDTVTLGSYLPGQATAGNAVYLPNINNESYTSGISATEL